LNTIILASGSPRRKKLLEQLGLPFQVHPSLVNEQYDPTLPPQKIVQNLAQRKARDVAQKFHDALIIGADTIVAYNKEILEKPGTKDEARSMLRQLSDNTHSVFTGVALCLRGRDSKKPRQRTFFEETKVSFGPIADQDIRQYVESGSPMDKAGAYGIQDAYGSFFVKSIEGDYNTVVGFPLHRFYRVLQNFAPEYLVPAKNLR